MKVILLERVERLGALGEVVNVKDGFARNYLLPRAKALRANESNLKVFEAQRKDIEARNATNREGAEKSAKKIDGGNYVIIRQAGEGGQVDRSQVVLDRPIKNIGVHPVKVRLHAEVVITVNVNVARSNDEAVRQARGENVLNSQFDEDRAMAQQAAEELFEGGAGQAMQEAPAEEA